MRSFVGDFDWIVENCTALLADAPDVMVGEWQAIQSKDLPQASTIEVEDVSIEVSLPADHDVWAQRIKPNLPWAEEHFQERVSGIPHNPPPSHVRWPFAQRSNEEHTTSGKFSHTYPERFWPKWVIGEYSDGLEVHHGLRYPLGDLEDVVILLRDRPGTRQAFLPVWFPEDTGAVDNQRVPCTLGYHFLVRNGQLKIVYYIRSCDFYRHFRDDVYMAGRLGQWVSEQLGNVFPSRLVMHMSSLHIFSAERERVQNELAAIVRAKEQWLMTGL